jgi:Tol biopolymer transport system component
MSDLRERLERESERMVRAPDFAERMFERARRRERNRRAAALGVGAILFIVVLAIIRAGLPDADRTPRPATPTPPSLAPPIGTIVFGQIDGVTETYQTISPDGSEQRPIFEAKRCAPCVFLSPDGSRVMTAAFKGDRVTTATINADGTDRSVLPLPNKTINLAPGAWSPDGTRLALLGFDQSHPSRTGIFTARAADLSDLTRVTTSPDGLWHDPLAWSPDGTRILVHVERGSIGPVDLAGDLFVVSVDGTGFRRLTPPGVFIGRVRAAGNPVSWSPDGRQVAFGGFDTRADGGRSAMFVVDLEGGEPRRVTEWGQVIASVDWSPNGEWIAFSDLADPAVTLVRPNTGELVTLTPSKDRSCCPVWSPDGSLLLFQRGPEGERDLWTMDLEGKIVGRVTREPGDYFGYGWASAG